MTAIPARRNRISLSVAATVTLFLSACTATDPVELANRPTEFGHVHGLDIEPSSGTVYAATHNGVWEVPSIGSATVGERDLDGPIAGRVQDTMGFTIVDNQILASGHPDPLEHPDFIPANLGLIESYDNANTWSPISLWGETDFHDISAVRQATAALHIYGYDAGTGTVWFSLDSGRTWETGAKLAIRDLVADPTEPGALYATTEASLMVSMDNGATFAPAPDAPVLFLIDAGDNGELVGVDPDGVVWTRPVGGAWLSTGAIEGEVEAIAYSEDPQTLAAYDSRGIVVSDDLGSTWQVLVSR